MMAGEYYLRYCQETAKNFTTDGAMHRRTPQTKTLKKSLYWVFGTPYVAPRLQITCPAVARFGNSIGRRKVPASVPHFPAISLPQGPSWPLNFCVTPPFTCLSKLPAIRSADTSLVVMLQNLKSCMTNWGISGGSRSAVRRFPADTT